MKENVSGSFFLNTVYYQQRLNTGQNTQTPNK